MFIMLEIQEGAHGLFNTDVIETIAQYKGDTIVTWQGEAENYCTVQGTPDEIWDAINHAEEQELRDKMAMAALTGLQARAATDTDITADDFAHRAYAMADAMMRMRGGDNG